MKPVNENAQAAKKSNGSAELRDKMANADAGQNADAPAQEEQIAVAAYFRAEKRGFAPGNEMDDWLRAEAEHNLGREG
jgi:hypothetical protein